MIVAACRRSPPAVSAALPDPLGLGQERMKRLLGLYQQYSRVNAHVKSGEVTRADLATLQNVKRALIQEHNAAPPAVQKKAAGIYKELMSQLDTTLDTVTRRLSSSRIHAAEQLGQRMCARRSSRTTRSHEVSVCLSHD
jgi:hypothetical protein